MPPKTKRAANFPRSFLPRPPSLSHRNHHQQLTNTILDIVQQAANYKQLRKGANEGTKGQRCRKNGGG
jgi:hypothetical protein